MSTNIRGTRVNLAAAICWENYMPLLRQSLYAQNVNLYLAPTADGRDTWLSLMRTVAIEGRCFVVSSNMAARDPGAAPASAPVAAPAPPPIATPQPMPNGPTPDLSPTTTVNGDGFRKSKRRSVPCGDGNEIILPEPRPRPSQQQSRNSIVFEDGNEIVFPERPPAPEGPPAPAAPPVRQAPRRRSSIVCKDGSEMAYPPSISSWPSGPDPDPAAAAAAATATSQRGPAVSWPPKAPVQNGIGGKGWVSRGGSSIVGPYGDVLAGPQWEDDEGIIYADVDFEDCIRGRLDLDTAGSYSRLVAPFLSHSRIAPTVYERC